jgi:hypothetical protein
LSKSFAFFEVPTRGFLIAFVIWIQVMNPMLYIGEITKGMHKVAGLEVVKECRDVLNMIEIRMADNE